MQFDQNEWLPVESNPEVINSFIQKLGFDTTKYAFTDVLSTEDWAQAIVPQPCLAVIFLFPISTKQLEYEREEADKLNREGQRVSKDVFFMRQFNDYTCGTIAAFHILANLAKCYPDLIAKDSTFAKFYETTKDSTPEERGKHFKRNQTVETAHKQAASEGQTAPSADINTHFIAFVEVDGHLYELDGRKGTPINHGECRGMEILPKACETINKFMARDPEEMRFTIMALSDANAECYF